MLGKLNVNVPDPSLYNIPLPAIAAVFIVVLPTPPIVSAIPPLVIPPLNVNVVPVSLLIRTVFVDKVIIFETDYQLEQFIIQHQPCVMVKGDEYKNKKIIGAEHCKDIVFFQIVEGFSTTEILEKITSQ